MAFLKGRDVISGQEVNCTPKVRQKKSNFWGVLL